MKSSSVIIYLVLGFIGLFQYGQASAGKFSTSSTQSPGQSDITITVKMYCNDQFIPYANRVLTVITSNRSDLPLTFRRTDKNGQFTLDKRFKDYLVNLNATQCPQTPVVAVDGCFSDIISVGSTATALFHKESCSVLCHDRDCEN